MENKEQKTFEPQSASGVAEKYAEILLQVKGLMEGVDNPVGVLANVAALLKEAFDYYFGWDSMWCATANCSLVRSRAPWLVSASSAGEESVALHGLRRGRWLSPTFMRFLAILLAPRSRNRRSSCPS